MYGEDKIFGDLCIMMYTPKSVSDAIQLLEGAVSIVDSPEESPLCDCIGRISAEAMRSAVDIPMSETSIVDGFAVKSTDFEMNMEYIIVDKILAGSPESLLAGNRNAIYVATGANLPHGADMVIPIEKCRISGDRVVFLDDCEGVRKGQNVRIVGSDTQAGDPILRKGAYIGPSELSLLSACKVVKLQCYNKIRISVLSTGLEIQSGQVGDTNRPFIISRLNESDFVNNVHIKDLGIIPDNYEAFSDIVTSSDFDILVTSGSVSKGSSDFFKAVLENSTEWTILFGQLDLKPGKPTTVAVSRDKKRIIFCLPGNPASCFVTFNLFVLPTLARMCGYRNSSLDRLSVPCLDPFQTITPDADRPEYLRAIISLSSKSGRLITRLVDGHQRSSRVASTVDVGGGHQVNALIIIPPNLNAISTDRAFDAILLPGRRIYVDSTHNSSATSSTISESTKAAAFDKLVEWLKVRNDVENIDLMNLAGFCRNCLSKWLAQSDPNLELDSAKQFVYGMDYEKWKKFYRKGEKKEHGPRLVVPTTISHSNPCASSIKPNQVKFFVLTISDRAAAGVYSDESGPKASEVLKQKFRSITETAIVPDEVALIRQTVDRWSLGTGTKVIITTGGTGHGVRDVTFEAIFPLILKRSSGLEHLLLSEFIALDLMFALTRPLIGIASNSTIIVCLPGRPEAVSEGLRILTDPIRKLIVEISS
jgi:molybdenum cofactor synthesis domain-containing protein